MLPRMLRAELAVSQSVRRLARAARALGCLVALGLANACAVYAADLVDDAAPGVMTSGASGALGGRSGSVAGKPNGSGGMSADVDVPGAGGDQAPDEPSHTNAGTSAGVGGAGAAPGNAGSGTMPSLGGSGAGGLAGGGTVTGGSGSAGTGGAGAGGGPRELLDGV